MGGPTASAKTSHDYRPEIDGLRAIAVLCVILYHLRAGWLPGGFVGVDVFFVISGFLITGFVRREVSSNRWRYSTFLVRRVRRLAPPLLFVTICSCIAAYFLLLPSHLASFAKSVVAQPIALQNMHFLAEGEYFQGSERKPLLHTWSLGVEEQFYFIWPFVVVFISRFQRRIVLAILAVILLLSFGLNLVLPVVSPKASFFILPARAWELGVGGALSIFLEERQVSASKSGRDSALIATVSLAVLSLSFVRINGQMQFPGWVASLPVGATAGLILAFTIGDSPIKRVLSARPFVYVGLISYSLYLWHWPIIVFSRFMGIDPSRPLPMVMLIAVASLAAALSYRIVEQPIRNRRVLSSARSLLGWTAGVGVVLVSVGLISVRTNGLAFRYHGTARSMLTAPFDVTGDDRCGILFRMTHPREQVCRYNQVSVEERSGVLVWGNSHAAMWLGALSRMGDRAERPIYLNARNCRATTDSAFCNGTVQARVLSFIEANRVSDVILASSWYGAYGIPDAEFERQLRAVVHEITSRHIDVWLVVDVPTSEALSPEDRYLRNPESPSFGSISLAEHQIKRDREVALFRDIAQATRGVHIIDPTLDFCYDGQRCYGGRDGRAYYRDGGHITNSGAAAAMHRFSAVFAR